MISHTPVCAESHQQCDIIRAPIWIFCLGQGAAHRYRNHHLIRRQAQGLLRKIADVLEFDFFYFNLIVFQLLSSHMPDELNETGSAPGFL